MSQTYTSVSDREFRAADRAAHLRIGPFMLALTSLVAMLVIAFAYAGRISTLGLSDSSQQRVRLANPNTVCRMSARSLRRGSPSMVPNARFSVRGILQRLNRPWWYGHEKRLPA